MKKLALVLLLASCSGRGRDEWSAYRTTLPPDQASYMALVDQTGQILDVLNQDIEKTMVRARTFLDEHAGGHEQKGMTLRAKGGSYTYRITAEEFMDEWEVHVLCAKKGEPESEEAYRNARICAYFLLSGKLPYPDLISR